MGFGISPLKLKQKDGRSALTPGDNPGVWAAVWFKIAGPLFPRGIGSPFIYLVLSYVLHGRLMLIFVPFPFAETNLNFPFNESTLSFMPEMHPRSRL